MAGISSKAAGKLENKRKFNGIEHNTDLDLNHYDAFFRNADPQIGRWWQIDPKPNMAESPYSMMGNNPIISADFLGDTPRVVAPIIIPQNSMPNVYQNHMNYLKKHPNEAINIGNITLILFDYEPDKTQQEKNRKENKRANPVNNKDGSKQEDEVAPASTKQGGARGVRMAVPQAENSSHGGQLGIMIKLLGMCEGDMFATILIPNSSNTVMAGELSTTPDFSGAKSAAKQSGRTRTTTQSQGFNPVPAFNVFRLGLLGAAVGAAINTLNLLNNDEQIEPNAMQ
jgi:RHS repeat-associated protein